MRIFARPFIVRLIIKINIIVFALWYLSLYAQSDFMVENFLVSWDSLIEGRPWTLLTSVFSHNSFIHIFLNMYVLYGFGSAMESALGSKRFLNFYLVAGIIASLSHCLVSNFILGAPALPALGASGAVAGVILVFSLIFPKERILLLGIIPLPAIWGAVLLVALDLWGLLSQARGSGLPIGHGAHLGGALAGLLYYVFILRSRFAKTDHPA